MIDMPREALLKLHISRLAQSNLHDYWLGKGGEVNLRGSHVFEGRVKLLICFLLFVVAWLYGIVACDRDGVVTK